MNEQLNRGDRTISCINWTLHFSRQNTANSDDHLAHTTSQEQKQKSAVSPVVFSLAPVPTELAMQSTELDSHPLKPPHPTHTPT
ncbi:hypothetical protein Pst134EA_013524 [Puccinia striiformis f. sp. tritici]|uniref:hypothetical protein n=1 Tax=Puccinia striiformis f. sp. tritici TaxID=168172 RepID=UPI0020088476|nr:hypothetical protein Pst134EA_013524 [Puccinia striiformis f. sp. tritici]KAH9465641.1 hypothetical protein Pst134EA_013524 [Puccinia striiformis f. sp. tritici]